LTNGLHMADGMHYRCALLRVYAWAMTVYDDV
jgi:hypothetical protein